MSAAGRAVVAFTQRYPMLPFVVIIVGLHAATLILLIGGHINVKHNLADCIAAGNAPERCERWVRP